MNFTREPIIETIVTPRDGYKLLVRNSKGGTTQEDYFVDALEVVSFGHSFFFRSLERPKSFLLPVSDYEVIEMKEVRVALKNAPHERSIKIGGGREASLRAPREPQADKEEELTVSNPSLEGEESSEAGSSQHNDKKRNRGRNRRRRSSDDQRAPREWETKRGSADQQNEVKSSPAEDSAEEGGGANDEMQVSSSTFTKLIPPPTTLISDTISRYKDFALPPRTHLPKQGEDSTLKEEPEALNEEKREEEIIKEDQDSPPFGEAKELNRSAFAPSFESQPIENFTSQRSFLSDDYFRS